jgi:hypothetical protein
MLTQITNDLGGGCDQTLDQGFIGHHQKQRAP